MKPFLGVLGLALLAIVAFGCVAIWNAREFYKQIDMADPVIEYTLFPEARPLDQVLETLGQITGIKKQVAALGLPHDVPCNSMSERSHCLTLSLKDIGDVTLDTLSDRVVICRIHYECRKPDTACRASLSGEALDIVRKFVNDPFPDLDISGADVSFEPPAEGKHGEWLVVYVPVWKGAKSLVPQLEAHVCASSGMITWINYRHLDPPSKSGQTITQEEAAERVVSAIKRWGDVLDMPVVGKSELVVIGPNQLPGVRLAESHFC